MTQGNYKLVKTLLLLFLGVWLIFTLFPLYFMIVTSLKPVEEINRMIPTFWPETMKFNNYAGIFADPGSLKSLVDSVIVSVTNTALSLFLGTLAGYALARWVRGVDRREPGVLDPVEPHVPAGRGDHPHVLPLRLHALGHRQLFLADRALSRVQPAAGHLADDGVSSAMRRGNWKRPPISTATRRSALSSG